MLNLPGFDGTVTFQSLNGDPLPDCIGDTQPQVPPSDDDGVSLLGPAITTTEGKIETY